MMNLPVEMAAFEKIIHAQHLRFALSKGEFAADMPRFSHLQQSLQQTSYFEV